jgi:phosphoglycerate dehydrogenase-like enzyme
MRIVVLDDWQGYAERATDWARVRARAELVFLRGHHADPAALAAEIGAAEAVVAMRERSVISAALLDLLPGLRLLSFTGPRNASVDVAACSARKVLVCNTPAGRSGHATAELALGLLLACARRIALGDAEMRAGRFQANVAPGIEMAGRTLGIIGLGRIGGTMARYGNALGMRVIAWSQNLTEERAAEAGAARVSKGVLVSESDAISLHVVLSPRSVGIVGAEEIARLKPGCILINTSRGALIDQPALLAALHAGRVMAGLDVYESEPVGAGDPILAAPNTVLSPHLGYATSENLADFYRYAAENVSAWLEGAPIRMVNPEILA